MIKRILNGFNESIVSVDPNVWNKINSPFVATISNPDVTYGNGMFVAVFATEIAISVDGLNWTNTNTNVFSGSSIRSVAFGNGVFLIVGSGGKIATSTNGTTWTPRTGVMSTSTITAAVYGGGRFLISGASGRLSTSPDGITWTLATTVFGTTNIAAVAYGYSSTYGDIYFATGSSGKMAYSYNGLNWTLLSYPFANAATSNIVSALCYNNNDTFTVGTTLGDSAVYSFVTGTFLNIHTNTIGTGLAIYGAINIGDGTNNKCLLTGNKLATSTDNGVNWNITDAFGGSLCSTITNDSNKFLAIGISGAIYTKSFV